MATRNAKGPVTVSSTQELREALANGHTADEITIAAVDVEKIKTEAHAAGVAEAAEAHKTELTAKVKEASDNAVKAERARIAGLQAIAMQGFEKEVAKAIEDGSAVEATAVSIARLARERGTTVAAQKGDAPAALGHGGGAQIEGRGNKWGSITSRFKKRA